ncbi:MAG: KH domain-containing protein [Verrucomicrobia bacterium]|nr:KH domain-containing protein [Verrucomicrobiota bacterium]
MKGFLDYTIRMLIQHPEDFVLSEVDGGRTTFFRVEMHRDDVGRVIGKSGHTINAIRNLMTAAGERDGRRVQIEIIGAQP